MRNLVSLLIGLLCLIPGVGSIQVIPIGERLGLNVPLIIISCEIINTIPECLAPAQSGSIVLVSYSSTKNVLHIIYSKVGSIIIGILFGMLISSIVSSWQIDKVFIIGVAGGLFSLTKDKLKSLIYLAIIAILWNIEKNGINPISVIILSLGLFKTNNKESNNIKEENIPLGLLANAVTLWLPGINASGIIASVDKKGGITSIVANAMNEGIGIGLTQGLVFSGKSMIGSVAEEPISIPLILISLCVVSYIGKICNEIISPAAYNNKLALVICKVVTTYSLLSIAEHKIIVIGIAWLISKIKTDDITKALTFLPITI